MGNKPGRSRKGTLAEAAVVEAVTVKDLDSVQKTEVLAAPTQGRPRPPQRRRPTATGGGARRGTKPSFKNAATSVMVTKAAEGFYEKQRSLSVEDKKEEDPAEDKEVGGAGVKDGEVKDNTMTGAKTKKFIPMKTPSLIKEPSVKTEVKSETVPNQKRPQSEVFPRREMKTTLLPKSHSFGSDPSSQLPGEPESKTDTPTRSDLPHLEEENDSCHDDAGKITRANDRSKALSLGGGGDSFEEAPLQRKITSPKIAMDLSSVDEEEEIAETDLIQRFMKKQQKLASLIEEETVGGKSGLSGDKEVGDKFEEAEDPLEDCNYENATATEEVQSYKVAKENVSGEYFAGEKVTTVLNSGEKVTTQNVGAVQGAENTTGQIPAEEKGTSDSSAGVVSSMEKADFDETGLDKILEEKDTSVQDAEEKEVEKEVAKEKIVEKKVAREKEVEEGAFSSKSAEDKHSAEKASVGMVISEKTLPEKVSAEKATTEKATKEKAVSEKDYKEKVAREKSASEKAASEKAAAEKSAEERAADKKGETERASLEKAAQEKSAQEKAAVEKVATEIAAAEKSAEERAADKKGETERASLEKAAQEKSAQEKAAVEKVATEIVAAEKIAKAKSAAESTASEKAAEEKSATDKAAEENVFAEKDVEVKACTHRAVEETVIIDQEMLGKVDKESSDSEDGARHKSTAGKGSSKKAANSVSNTDSGGQDSFFSLGVEPDVTDNNLIGI